MKKYIASLFFLAFLIGRASSVAAQDLKAFEPLKDPRIRTMPAQKMLVVETKGDPNTAGQAGFSLLFKTFFSLPGVTMAAPRGRWSNSLTAPKNEWSGLLALPLPDSVAGLPAGTTGAKIEIWQYGEVAEILHLGGYDKEPPTVEKLLKFIAEKGYAVAGPHEEEYLKGPGMAPGPDDYWTIIRYQVKKK
jgi:hypothetical protein